MFGRCEQQTQVPARQSVVRIALTELKFQADRCCLGLSWNLTFLQPEIAEIISLSVHAFAAILLPLQVVSMKSDDN